MRQIGVGSNVSECELQHGHSGDVVTIAQRNHIGSNEAEVFGEKRQSPELIAHFIEELVSRPIHPAAANRGRLIGGNFPELCETAKMVEPNEVASLRGPAQAQRPPPIFGGANRVPVVQRVTPPLPGSAEVVGRHAGYGFRLQIVFQTKQIAMRPDVRAFVIDEYSNVTDHANGFLRTVMPQCVPLFPEKKLHHSPGGELVAEIAFRGIQRTGVSPRELAGPLAPISSMFLADRVEENVVLDPPIVFFAESVEPLTWGP